MPTKSSTFVHYEHRLKEDIKIPPSDHSLRSYSRVVPKGETILRTHNMFEPAKYYPDSNFTIDASLVEVVKVTTKTEIGTEEKVVKK